MMKVGEVFLPDDQDFQRFKTDCTTDQGWTISYDKASCRVATKKNTLSPFDVIRVKLFYSIFQHMVRVTLIFRFNPISLVYQVNYFMMLFTMVNFVQHGIPR
jgi:hypothetical protein